MYKVQVDENYYDFLKYMDEFRWISTYKQIEEIEKLRPESILEVGIGTGFFGNIMRFLKYNYTSVDFDESLKPDIVASILNLPFENNSFDMAVSFQVLEHLEYKDFIPSIRELRRVSKRNIVISLPDTRRVWMYNIYIPKLGNIEFNIPRPQLKSPVHKFDGEHYWEISKRGYPLDKIIKDIESTGAKVQQTYRVKKNPFHRFFIIDVNKD